MSHALEEARKLVAFDTKELSHIIWEGKERWERFQKFQALVDNDPILRNNPSQTGMSRQEIYEMMCHKTKRLLEIAPLSEIKEFATQIFPEALVSSLNYEMFMPTIQNLGTDEQQKLFYEPARRWEILGCYAQTELAHGSDLNRIETTATYDKQTKEFIINTPNLGATKWWGSDVGLTSTHACTQAQLVIDGKKHGVQNFIVPIRHVKTHEPLPGIKVGDIGPKFGYNAKDNGYISFDNVRIPKVNMLSRYVQVQDDGSVTKTGDDKVWYATMQLQRQHFLDASWKTLGQGLTIIVRYSLLRTQFKDKTGKEIPIFNYQLQQARIIPMISEMYANMFGSRRILQMCQQNVQKIKQNNDFSMMMEIHVVLAAAKAFYTWNTFFGLERIRQCAGGHGYLIFSGLPQLVTEFAACVTAEGDNTVLSLSVGKALMAYLQKSFKTGKAPNQTVDYLEGIFDYLSEVKQVIQTKDDLYDVAKIKEVLRYNVAFNVATAGQKLQELMGEKQLSFKEATDKHMGIILNEIARTQSNYWTFRTFAEEVAALQNKAIATVLNKVNVLYGLMKILETQTQLFEYGVLQSKHFKWVREVRDELYPYIKEQAIGLVEPLGYSDSALKTAIGRSTGNPYETLLSWSKEHNAINDIAFQEEVFKKMKAQRGPIPGPRI